jgi:hypothetical protein
MARVSHNTGSGIDIWRGAGPRAHFCNRFISLHLCSRNHGSIPGPERTDQTVIACPRGRPTRVSRASRKPIRLRDLPRHKSLPVLWHCGLLGEKGSANAENRNGGTKATWESEGDNDRNTARADSPPECMVEREGRLSHGAAGETMESGTSDSRGAVRAR